MSLVKKRIGLDGRISIGEALKIARIQPGEFVEVIPSEKKIIIRVSKHRKTKGKVSTTA